MKAPLTDLDFIEAANLLNCEVAAIRAVAEVESGPRRFLPGRLPGDAVRGPHFLQIHQIGAGIWTLTASAAGTGWSMKEHELTSFSCVLRQGHNGSRTR